MAKRFYHSYATTLLLREAAEHVQANAWGMAYQSLRAAMSHAAKARDAKRMGRVMSALNRVRAQANKTYSVV